MKKKKSGIYKITLGSQDEGFSDYTRKHMEEKIVWYKAHIKWMQYLLKQDKKLKKQRVSKWEWPSK